MRSRAFMKNSDIELICKNSFYFGIYYISGKDVFILDCTDNNIINGGCNRCIFHSTIDNTCTISNNDALSPEQVQHLRTICPEMFI